MSDVLRFAVYTVGAGFATYAATKAAAQAVVDKLFAVYGPYSEVREYYGGNSTPNGTKCATPFMDPTDRDILADGDLLAGCTFIEEVEVADDPGWAPPPNVLGRHEDQAHQIASGKRQREMAAKARAKKSSGR